MSKSGLGRGLSSLIPNKDEAPVTTSTKQPDQTIGQVSEVDINKVHHNPRQPRQEFGKEELADLKASIKKHGILQPLVVSLSENEEYELIAGERRLRAAKDAGVKQVPIVVRTVSDQEKLELALIENVQRQDLNALEEAQAFKSLIEEFDLTQEEVAERVGKARPTVANIIRLLDLPEEIQQALRDGRLSRTHARTLLAEKNLDKQKKLFQAVLSGGVTVRETEAKAGTARRSSKTVKQDPNIIDLENKLREKYGTKVTISQSQGSGRITIEFYSRTDLKKLIDQLID